MTALARARLRHVGRRRKASSEGTRGDVGGAVASMAMAIDRRTPRLDTIDGRPVLRIIMRRER